MPEFLQHLLQGEYGQLTLRSVKAILLISLVVATWGVLVAAKPKAGKTQFTLLRWSFVGIFIAIFCYQAYWQLLGFTDPNFIKFARRYNRRPNASQKQIARGPIFDRRGLVLAAPVTGEVWGRRYPLGAAAAHPLGYYNSHYGLTGVERVCDPILSGYLNEKWEERVSKALFAPRVSEGDPVTLTLDQRLQLKAYQMLNRRKGAVIIMQPQGALLALVSSPGFNPQAPEGAFTDNLNTPLFNRAVQGRYPPGSTFKLLIAAMALEQNLSPTYACPAGGYIAGPNTPAIRDSEYYAWARRGATWRGWGQLNLTDALVHSSNVYFAQLGVACGVTSFQKMMTLAQINTPLPYLEAPGGTLQSSSGTAPENPKERALALLAIGQGAITVTPLHIASFTAAIAADGLMYPPHLLTPATPVTPQRVCSPLNARKLRTMMHESVKRGTGKECHIPYLTVGGKTGTAQVTGAADHAWFTCLAPVEHPTMVITVLVENGGFGAQTALPIAKLLLQEAATCGYFNK